MEASKFLNGASNGNKSVCIRLNISKSQNQILEDLMAISGAKTKAGYVRDCVFNHSKNMLKQINEMHQKICVEGGK